MIATFTGLKLYKPAVYWDERRLEEKETKTCPFYNNFTYSTSVTNAAAVKLARKVDAESFFEDALEKGAFDGNVVLVGDSLTRQQFIAIGSLLHKAGLADEHYVAWRNDVDKGHPSFEFNDARIRFNSNDDSSQVFFHPNGGLVFSYGWGVDNEFSPMHGEEDWLQSCKERKPFLLDTYKINPGIEPRNRRVPFDKKDEHFEKVALSGNDVIIFNAGYHVTTREDNLRNIAELADCMKEAKEKGDALDWPTILYMRTSQQHFPTETGAYPTKRPLDMHCLSIEKSKNLKCPYLAQDIEELDGKLPILGKDMDINLPHLHVSHTDCSHWAMPGVPSMFAKEIMSALMNIKEKRAEHKINGTEKGEMY